MQFKTVKTLADIPFKGIELVKVDASVRSIIIGGKLRVESDYGLRIMVEVPGETAKRYRVKATLDGFPAATEYLEYSHEADSRVEHFKDLGATVEKSQVEVFIADGGDITEGAGPASADADFDAIPF